MSLEENIRAVEGRIVRACQRAGRERGSVQLIAVTKTHPPETVREALRLGLAAFGESKVQEARAKIPEVGGAARWDFIGHLQTNKAPEAVALFELIHSVDSVRLMEILEKAASAAGKTQRILVEVNVSSEGSKFGIAPAALADLLKAANGMRHLAVEGLMTMAPFAEDPEKTRPYFRKLRELRDQARQATGIPLTELSMGMSGDFDVGIEEGSTLVRVGTALFGKRSAGRLRGG